MNRVLRSLFRCSTPRVQTRSSLLALGRSQAAKPSQRVALRVETLETRLAPSSLSLPQPTVCVNPQPLPPSQGPTQSTTLGAPHTNPIAIIAILIG
jgi:hypothetical protein